MAAKIDRLELEQAMSDPVLQFINTQSDEKKAAPNERRSPLVSVIIPFVEPWNTTEKIGKEQSRCY